MRTLERNKQRLYYSLYEGKKKIYDINGDIAGECESYSYPVEFFANISPNKGESNAEPFGANLDYTRTICTNEELPIDEHSIILFETDISEWEDDGSTADYDVVAVAKSLNSTLYALRKRVKNGTQKTWYL